jgi:ArsR family transcriptional regulator
MDVLQLPQSTVSRHLKLLADQGFVTSRSHGTANFYALRNGELPQAARRLWKLVREQTEGWATLRQDELRLESRLSGRESAQAFFARSAEGWDALRQELYGSAFSQAALAALLPREWVVADLACGTGALMAALLPHVRRVIGVDQSAAMLRAARRRLQGRPQAELRQGDLESLPLEDASCDAALLVLALTYVEQPARALAEAARILRPGGRLVVVDLLRHDREEFRRNLGQRHPGFEPAVLERLLREAGFTAARPSPLAPEAQAQGPALLLASGERTPASVSDSQTPKTRPARGPERTKR